MEGTSLGDRWSRLGWWKWVIVGVVLVAVFGGDDSKKEDGREAASELTSKPTATPSLTPSEVTREMIERDGTFWVKQSRPVKLELVDHCVDAAKERGEFSGDAARFASRLKPETIASKLDAFYADTEDRPFSGKNIEEAIEGECGGIAEDLADAAAERREKALEASVKPKNFRATPKLIRRYFKLESREDDLRSVKCSNRTSCSVAINSTVGDLGVIAKIFGDAGEAYSKDFVLQLASDITPIFHRLFGDPKFQQGTVSAWLEVQDVGGNVKRVPALTVTCDRAADAKINWERVAQAGLAEYCGYELTPISGVSAP